MLGRLRRHQVLGGYVLMFACTWPVDLWVAADSHGWTAMRVPPLLPVLVGYGFVAAALAATAAIEGRDGVGAVPDFTHPFASRIMPSGVSLWLAAPLFLLWQALIAIGLHCVAACAVVIAGRPAPVGGAAANLKTA